MANDPKIVIREADIGETSQQSAMHMMLQAWLYEKGLLAQDYTHPCEESVLDFAAYLVDHFEKYLEVKAKLEEGRRKFHEEHPGHG